jgi:chemotaxis receptor (MCP) glutamine deamidase CheD/FixJ family two-component response regulator
MNGKIKVLIVDDQALVLDILAKGLAIDPMIEIVGTATDGLLALNQLDRLKPDVIVLDMEMPRMNGMQFLHHMMQNKPIPTIVLSALTFQDSKLTQEAFELGAVDFLSKPSGGARALPTLFNQLFTKIKIAASQDISHLKPQRNMPQRNVMPSSILDRNARTNQAILGMGAFEVTNEEGRLLKIFALGSCVGVGLFCPAKRTVVLCHVVLPNSTTDTDKAAALPGYFADSAITTMLNKLISMGCAKEQIFAKIAGGAKTAVDIGDYFSVGQRNSVSVKATLLKHGIKILGEDLAGSISRTVYVTPGDNKMHLVHPDKGNWEI